ncbi:MAG: hypothetical protein FCKEOINB_02077 [Nitrosomonas sp.]|nr:hypothetical protein [Nitrosomonas sp.]
MPPRFRRQDRTRVERFPGMAIHHFKRGWQLTIAAQGFVGIDRLLPLMLAHQSLPPPLRHVVRADGFEVAHHADHVVVRQRDVFHVHHRRGKTVIQQQIADVVHVGEPVDVLVAVDTRERLAQFLQRIRAECAEHQQPVGAQYAVHFGKGAIQIVAPLQRKVRPDQADAFVLKWQLLDIAAHVIAALLQRQQTLPPSGVRTRVREHRPGNIECDQTALRIAFSQLLRAVTGAAAGIENHIRLVFDIFQARQHAIADFALQHRCVIVAACGTFKRGAQLFLIKRLFGIH